MNRFKLEAYQKEFPFLRDIIGDNIPDSVRVKRADENLLKVIPESNCHDGSMGISESEDKFHFILEDGSIIFDAVKKAGHTSSNYAHSQPQNWTGETVLEAIDRHGVADELQFIVQQSFLLDDWSGGEYKKELSFIVYKTPKNITFGAEIEKAKARALSEVRAEADF